MERYGILALLSAALCLRCAQVEAVSDDTSERGYRRPRFAEIWDPLNAAGSLPVANHTLDALKAEAREMFFHAYNGYMTHGFPSDDVQPWSCAPSNSQGGVGITLLDSLDALLVMSDPAEFRRAVDIVSQRQNFSVDARVHTFELTIRAMGGLLSAHVQILRNPELHTDYSGRLLDLAVDLADRILPAFDTTTGIPLSWVNLARGKLDSIQSTCTACATTLALELGLLSHLTGNPVYKDKADAAVRGVFDRRSSVTGLIGNTIHTESGSWDRSDSGIGAGSDSFYEYLLKTYIMFGDEEYLQMFAQAYTSADKYMRLRGTVDGFAWLIDVHMHTGQATHPSISSLSAFWPGMQAYIGQTDLAADLLANYTSAFQHYGWLPEQIDVAARSFHHSEVAYPLRPEVIESAYALFAATNDTKFVRVGQGIMETLNQKNRVRCGFASVKDVETGALEDGMESFFLSETSRYLYLLFSGSTAPLDFYIFNTEGHLMPVLPTSTSSPDDSTRGQGIDPFKEHSACSEVCTPLTQYELALHVDAAKLALPSLSFDADSARLIRERRCNVCAAVHSTAASLGPEQSACEQRETLRYHFDQPCRSSLAELTHQFVKRFFASLKPPPESSDLSCPADSHAECSAENSHACEAQKVAEMVTGHADSADVHDRHVLVVMSVNENKKLSAIETSLVPKRIDAVMQKAVLPGDVLKLKLTNFMSHRSSLVVVDVGVEITNSGIPVSDNSYDSIGGMVVLEAIQASFGPRLHDSSACVRSAMTQPLSHTEAELIAWAAGDMTQGASSAWKADERQSSVSEDGERILKKVHNARKCSPAQIALGYCASEPVVMDVVMPSRKTNGRKGGRAQSSEDEGTAHGGEYDAGSVDSKLQKLYACLHESDGEKQSKGENKPGDSSSSQGSVTGPVVIADPIDACVGGDSSHPGAKGAIVLAYRGGCTYQEKMKVLEEAGAIGIIIANVIDDGLVGMAVVEPVGPMLPAVLIRGAGGRALKELVHKHHSHAQPAHTHGTHADCGVDCTEQTQSEIGADVSDRIGESTEHQHSGSLHRGGHSVTVTFVGGQLLEAVDQAVSLLLSEDNTRWLAKLVAAGTLESPKESLLGLLVPELFDPLQKQIADERAREGVISDSPVQDIDLSGSCRMP